MLEHSVNPEPDNDDEPVGRVLSRREIIRLLGLGGGLAAASITGLAQQDPHNGPGGHPGGPGAPGGPGGGPGGGAPGGSAPGGGAPSSNVSLPGCVARPAQTEGPYFVDEKLNRSDIRSDPASKSVSGGVPLRLRFLVSTVGKTCLPLTGAVVDIWHCDAAGRYSDEQANNTVGQKFLRGFQVTDAKGVAEFLTIYPGWYQPRTVHIHFKIRLVSGEKVTHEFTSQVFFNDALTDRVFKNAAYAGRGTRNQRNANDGIYQNGGNQLMLEVKPDGAGYAATFEIGMNMPS